MVTLVKPYSTEVWVYRCRVAAVINALIHTLDCSHRRTCRHHEYKPLLFQFFMLLRLLSHTVRIVLHTHGPPIIWDKRHRRMLSRHKHPTYSTIPHVSSNVVFDHVMSSFFTEPIMQCLPYSSGPISVNTSGQHHEIEIPSINTDIPYKSAQPPRW